MVGHLQKVCTLSLVYRKVDQKEPCILNFKPHGQGGKRGCFFGNSFVWNKKPNQKPKTEPNTKLKTEKPNGFGFSKNRNFLFGFSFTPKPNQTKPSTPLSLT